MKRQMALRLQNTEQLETVWRKLGQTSRQELAEGFARLIAQAAQVEQSPTDKEGRDESRER